MARSACGVSVSVSVAELLPGFGSVVPPAAVTVAVFARLPVALVEIVPVAVYVTEPPAGRLTVSPILPLPAAVHVPPPAPTHVHVTPVIVPGNVSATVALVLLGPAFEAVMVYVTELPGTSVAEPSVFVIARSDCAVRVSTSVAELLLPLGSVVELETVAVFASEPVADALIVQLAV